VISPKGQGKASYTQDIREAEVAPRRRRERRVQRIQMDEPVLGDPTRNPLESPRTRLFQRTEHSDAPARQCEAFPPLQFRSHQICYVDQFALCELAIDTSIGRLKNAFDCPRAPVKKALRNGLEPPKRPGRHIVLPDDSEAEADILAWIHHQAEKS
jgi:hypothetical protein